MIQAPDMSGDSQLALFFAGFFVGINADPTFRWALRRAFVM
jgi:hypothetical protein